jgi:hypothetical protein
MKTKKISRGYEHAHLRELRPAIEAFIYRKIRLRVTDVLVGIGIAPDRAGYHIRRYVNDVLKEHGWEYKTVYSRHEEGKGSTTKAWINYRYKNSLEYLRAPAPAEVGESMKPDAPFVDYSFEIAKEFGVAVDTPEYMEKMLTQAVTDSNITDEKELPLEPTPLEQEPPL